MKVKLRMVTLLEGGGGKDKALVDKWLSRLVSGIADLGF